MALMHRRVATPSGVFSADTDWAAAGSLPTFGTDFASAEIEAKVTNTGKALVWVECRDGMGDTAAIVATGTFTWTGELLFRSRSEGENVVSETAAVSTVPGQREQAFSNLGAREFWVRLSAAANVPGTCEALWIYVDTNVR